MIAEISASVAVVIQWNAFGEEDAIGDLHNWSGRGGNQTESATNGDTMAILLVDTTRDASLSNGVGADDVNAVTESASFDIAPVDPQSAARETAVAGNGNGTSSSNADVDATVLLSSGKEYDAPEGVGEINCNDYGLLGEAP